MRLLSRWLSDRKVIGHAARAAALARSVGALLKGGRLSLTGLGRNMSGSAYVKHHIKAVDRLLANRHLHDERDGIFRAIARTLLVGNKRPVIIVDWSDFEHGRKCLMLKAAVPVGGRAVTLYERVFPMKRYNSPGAHREFLATLRSILPDLCRPIIVTDAGFRGPWFREVESYGWDWIGRIRSKLNYYCEKSGTWRSTASLHSKATSVTRFIGDVSLGQIRNSYRARLYLVRAHRRRVGPRRKEPRNQKNTKKYRRLHRAPWLLATSLPHKRGQERRIKQLYAQRMQIEETFRDLKGHRWGFALRYAYSRNDRRLDILLLIGSLATLVVWLVGLAGRIANRAKSLQANTESKREVLSTFFIGRQLLARPEIELNPALFPLALRALRRDLISDVLA
jgi:hypothetical protein